MIYQLRDGYFVRPLAALDLDGPYPAWFEDQEICRYNSHGKFFPTRAALLAYIENDATDRVVWAICDGNQTHVGNVSLQHISFVNRSAEFAILIGDRAHWGKGVATAAGRSLLAHGFFKLNLHRVHCGTAAANIGMVRLAAALGMREEGRRRQALYLEGEWIDVVEFGVLRDEFRPV